MFLSGCCLAAWTPTPAGRNTRLTNSKPANPCCRCPYHTLTQGALAPVLASASLFGIYLLLKYFPDLSLQTFLDSYFFLLGTAAITGAARPLLKRLPGPLGQPNMCFDAPDGLLLDEEGKAIQQVGSGFQGFGFRVHGHPAAVVSGHHTCSTRAHFAVCQTVTRSAVAAAGNRSSSRERPAGPWDCCRHPRAAGPAASGLLFICCRCYCCRSACLPLTSWPEHLRWAWHHLSWQATTRASH